MAREHLDVTVVALSNRSYAVLNYELRRVGAVSDGSTSQRMLDLDQPTLDLCKLAQAQGVATVRVTTADELVEAPRRSYATPGPNVHRGDAAQGTQLESELANDRRVVGGLLTFSLVAVNETSRGLRE